MARAKHPKEYIFETSKEKAAMKVNLNSIMTGSLFFILTLLWALDPTHFSPAILMQLVLAVPLLFVSTLSYAKIGYWEKHEHEPWEALGWFCNNLGNILVLNAIGLITASAYPQIAYAYFILLFSLMTIYSAINVYLRPWTWASKLFKYFFFLSFLSYGGVMQLP